MIDYYEVLKLAPDASEETIEEKYQLLLESRHPEASPGAPAEEQDEEALAEISLLHQAYEVLHHRGRRREYDHERNRAIEAARKPWSVPPAEPAPLPSSLPHNPPAPTLTPAATTSSPPWHDPFDARIVAAFLAGVLMASGALALRYWHRGPQEDSSWPGRILAVALSSKKPAYAPSLSLRPATPPPESASASGRNAQKETAPLLRISRRKPPEDAIEGQTGPTRRERPVSVDITPAKGQPAFSLQPVGNVEVFYPDGSQDAWTTRGNCGQAHVAADGTVGWTVYQATRSGNYDFQPNGTLVLRKRGQSIRITAPLEYIIGWNFLAGGKEVVVRSGRSSSPTAFARYESTTGRVLESVDASRSDLPAWASPVEDR